jgi:hypothetical protein
MRLIQVTYSKSDDRSCPPLQGALDWAKKVVELEAGHPDALALMISLHMQRRWGGGGWIKQPNRPLQPQPPPAKDVKHVTHRMLRF